MRPVVIGIGGAHSKVGKTTIACRILRRLRGWGAIKYSRTGFYSSIIDSPEIIQQKDKDTERLLSAGAQEVLWVQSPQEGLQEVLQIGFNKLSHLKGIIVEGNSAIQALKTDIVLFIYGSGALKRGADNILRMADIVLFDKDPPPGIPKKAKRFRSDNEERYMESIMKLINAQKGKR